jgi:hypothetical protein
MVTTALSVFYYKRHRHRDKARRRAAIRALQSTFRDLTDAPADMRLVATASAGLVPASVVLRGRAAVLDWVERDSREAGAWRARLTGVLRLLQSAKGSQPPNPTPPPPPAGLSTRWDWVQEYPQVFESFLTDPETGVRRSTRERYILAQSPVGAALLLGAHGT